MRTIRVARCALFAGLLLQGISGAALGATCTSAATGNWNVGATWAPGCGASGPVAGDTVNIGTTAAHTVTIPAGFSAAAASVTIGNTATNGAAALTLGAATTSLSVSGAVTVNRANNNNTTNSLNVNAGTASMASLTINGGAGVRLAQIAISTGTATVTGNVTIGGTTANARITFSDAGTLNIGGGLGNGGTLTAFTGTVVYNGAGAQNVGTYTYNNLTINKSSGTATLTGNATVSSTLTLTSGVVSTGANTLITTANCPGSVSRPVGGGHVAGFLRLQIPTGSPTCTFDVGDGTTYRSMNLTFTSVTTAGNLTGSVSQSAGDHPNISTSGLDSAQGVNRYWTLTNSGVVLSSYNATFNFVAGDVDAGADTTQFEVERWDGTAWNTTTAGTRTATSTQATGINAFSDFAVAKKKPAVVTPGSFNAFETSTAAGAVTGVIKTKIAGVAFSLDVVAISGGVQLAGFTDPVIVELLGNNTLGVGLDVNNCPTTFTLVQTVAPNPTITGGRSTVSFAAVPDVWRDVRVRIRWPTVSPTVTSCSTDNFAIRPNAFTSFSVTDADSQTPGTVRTLNEVTFAAGGVLHKAGRPFTVRADAVNAAGVPAIMTNYAGTPTPMLTTCAGAACTPTFGTFSLGASFVAGQLNSSAATYNEAGSFQLQLVDSTFSSVDAADGSTAAERNIVSATINVGRFVPDHFAVSLNAPMFGTACGAGSFTYVGQAFNYVITLEPVITVTAQDFANSTTTLYAGAWWRVTNASLTGKSYTAATGTVDTSGLPAIDPVIAPTGAGIGTLTFSSGTGLFFTRTTPVAPFDAEISLAINVIDDDGIAYGANPARFGQALAGLGISFNSGKPMRFGRLRLGNANGSQFINLLVPIEAQYWNGTSFLTNTADSCTAIAGANIALSNYTQNLNACETSVSISGSFSSGRGNLQLTAPGNANNGGAVLTVNLGVSGSGSTCIGGASTPVTGANLLFLRGNWTGGAYDQNPAARATFGVYKGSEEFIYFRENF